MRRPRTEDRETILEYMDFRCPGINSRSPVTDEEMNAVLEAFDRFNEFQSVADIAEKTRLTPDRTKTICFYLCLKESLTFETRETCPQEFAHAKHGRATWIFRRIEAPAPVRLIPNQPLFNLPDSSRDRLESALEKLRDDLRRYGLECDTLKIGDVLQVHIKGTPGGLLCAARHMAHRSF